MSATAERLIQRIYEDFNQLEAAIDGEAASVEQHTLAKLREVYLRAKRRGDDRLYEQAFRVYNRILSQNEPTKQQSRDHAETFANHIVQIVLRVLQEEEWLRGKPPEEIARLAVWLTEILKADFAERVIFEP